MSSRDIELVITWVDGSDPEHRAKRLQYDDVASSSHAVASSPTRFADNGEIYYLIASVLKYAPFITKIHIVTDGQKPEFVDSFAQAGFCTEDFIAIVDHKVVFDGLPAVLPTFNSLSIETAVWNIPGLCENFVYSNDDFFLNAPTSASAFFRDGKPMLYGRVKSGLRSRLKQCLRWFKRKRAEASNAVPSFTVAQEKGAELAGAKSRFLQVGHYFHAVRRSTLADYYAAHPDVLRQQLSHRFRNIAQHSPVALANHLEMERFGATPLPEHRTAYIKPRQKRATAPVLAMIEQGSAPFGCIQSQDELSIELRQALTDVMITKFHTHLPHRLIEHLRAAD